MKHKTMQGKEIDMDKLIQINETMPAIGNMRVNARGDELGPGGVIIRKREEVVAEYYETNPAAKVKRAAATVADAVPNTVATQETKPVEAPKVKKETGV
jgi:hypothetical protein